jgi:hypothetical protein
LVLATALLRGVVCADAAFHSSGSADIDAARRAVAVSPTDVTNHRERCLLLYLWLGALQQQGADTRPFVGVDTQYYRLEPQVNRLADGQSSPPLKQMCELVDRGYQAMDQIQTALVEQGPIFKPFEGKPGDAPTGGDPNAEWPMFQGNKHHTGFTTAPGPRVGRAAWKFPVGLGWYSRPVVEEGKVYIASPGMRAIAYCLDLRT